MRRPEHSVYTEILTTEKHARSPKLVFVGIEYITLTIIRGNMEKNEWYIRKEGTTEHLVYLDREGQELTKLINNEKTMLIRGASGKKSPLGGRAKEGDVVYFVEKGGSLRVTHRAVIENVTEKEKMSPEESALFIAEFKKELNLSAKQYARWCGKKCLGVYQVSRPEEIIPFTYCRKNNMDDWIITDDINKLRMVE